MIINRVYLAHGKDDDDNVRISIAIGLFLSKTVSLARAAEIANLSLSEFIEMLDRKGIPWNECSEESLSSDLISVRDFFRELGDADEEE